MHFPSILFLKFLGRIGLRRTIRLRTFNSLFEIHPIITTNLAPAKNFFQFSFWDSKAVKFYIWMKTIIQSFNSLFEIRDFTGSRRHRRTYFAFQFSFWDSYRSLDIEEEGVFRTFNSLFEILDWLEEQDWGIFNWLLSILFLRFRFMRREAEAGVEAVFQFSFWDSDYWNRVDDSGGTLYFQFSFWDSFLANPRIHRNPHNIFQFSFWDSEKYRVDIPLNDPNFQFSFWDSRSSAIQRRLGCLCSFNSLFEIQLLFHACSWKLTPHSFNSLFEILFSSFFLGPCLKAVPLSILFLRFYIHVKKCKGKKKINFQFSFWDS